MILETTNIKHSNPICNCHYLQLLLYLFPSNPKSHRGHSYITFLILHLLNKEHTLAVISTAENRVKAEST